MNRYVLEIVYTSGRTEYSSAPCEIQAEKRRNNYLAMPNVKTVTLMPVKERPR